IDSVLNLLFRCSHQRLTRPVTPVGRGGVPLGETYVVCLDCGKQFAYDTEHMRIGKPIESTHNRGVLPPAMPMPRKQKVKYALWATVPLAMVVGGLAKKKRSSGDTAKAAPKSEEPIKSEESSKPQEPKEPKPGE
ncbi:MAG TPA: hypothetical protein VG672_10780, partial [Bryobacteraceae bacterium]|nr:hypothetical protein [Bryobacteraceae bacterium]